MPIQSPYPLPASAQDLPVPADTADAKLFVCFVSGNDATTGLPWCPDVRAAMPRLVSVFGGKGEEEKEKGRLLCVQVGGRDEWKNLDNVYRKQWAVKALPQLVRYQRVDGEVKATGALVENEVNDDAKLAEFVAA